ncbi:hydrolase [Wenjunlia vitaminophila]|uniref:Hydrolase n=1 Tax=Wenjunlia vitaminophila TaxID=76728 RepID=A0A0T6LQE9_WENVI|nr:HAD family phosphatase [Wenjunlia vitaminophila]KRV48261.1 hydrolase [Wenjunlia vitaminophila]
MNHALPAVIFDLDGTLVDSEPNYFEATRQVLAAHGVHGFTWERHTDFIGIGTRETLDALRAEHGLGTPVDVLLAEKNDCYLRLARRSTRVFPGMRTLVELLHGAGHRLAVASGSSPTTIDLVLGTTGLGPWIPCRVSAEEVERGKPAPDVFLEAARRLGVAPRECVVVEDAPPGARAAHRAGMRCLAVPYLPEQADDPAFATAGLLVHEGHRAFDPRAAHDWITRGPVDPARGAGIARG